MTDEDIKKIALFNARLKAQKGYEKKRKGKWGKGGPKSHELELMLRKKKVSDSKKGTGPKFWKKELRKARRRDYKRMKKVNK